MADVVIRAQHISKVFRIHALQDSYQTLRDVLASSFRQPLNSLIALLGRSRAERPEDDIRWTALADVSFDVQRGEIVGIIGRNGAGKSTLLKILARITEPSGGTIRVCGRVGSLLEVGTGFHPELTGRENTYLNGAMLGMKKAEIQRRFDEIVAFAEVESFIDTPVKHYSSGMYLRLAFAVAAHLEQEILLVDEVLAVGDAAFQKKCIGKMSDIAGQGRTILFVSHNMAAVGALCRRALLFESGIIERDGPAEEVVRAYLQGAYLTSTRVWSEGKRPGNDCFVLSAVRILDSSGAETAALRLSEPLVVEIEYDVLKSGTRASFSVVLLGGDGYGLFGSLNNTEPNYYGRPLQKGRYRSRCTIGGDLLNTGTFNVSIIGFSGHWTDSFRVDQVVSFETVDDGHLRGDYSGPYGGPLRPRLLWETLPHVETSGEHVLSP